MACLWRMPDGLRLLETIGLRPLASIGAHRIHHRQGFSVRRICAAARIPGAQFYRIRGGADGDFLCLSSRLAQTRARLPQASRAKDFGMRSLSALICMVVFAASPVSYLKYERPIHLSTSGVQQYIIVDEAMWEHARPDLGDLRIYEGDTEIPYSIVTERDSLQRERTVVPVLQQSTVAGKTQFLIDMSMLAEYDHVDLDLTTRNFVAHARVEGENVPQSRNWAVLGDSILYDLSSDGLGRNHMLRLPRAKYRHLRVTIDGPVKPRDVRSASSETTDQQAAHWRDVAIQGKREEEGKKTVFTFTVPDGAPVDRVLFAADPGQPNFWRRVEVEAGTGATL